MAIQLLFCLKITLNNRVVIQPIKKSKCWNPVIVCSAFSCLVLFCKCRYQYRGIFLLWIFCLFLVYRRMWVVCLVGFWFFFVFLLSPCTFFTFFVVTEKYVFFASFWLSTLTSIHVDYFLVAGIWHRQVFFSVILWNLWNFFTFLMQNSNIFKHKRWICSARSWKCHIMCMRPYFKRKDLSLKRSWILQQLFHAFQLFQKSLSESGKMAFVLNNTAWRTDLLSLD